MSAERRQSEPAVAVLSEARPGSSDNLYLVKELVEERPAIHSVRAFQPDIGGVHATRVLDTELVAGRRDNSRVLLIVGDVLLALLLSLGRENSLRAALNGIRNAVEFAALSARPYIRKLDVISLAVLENKLVGYYGVAAAPSRKARRFGKRGDQDSALLRALYAEN